MEGNRLLLIAGCLSALASVLHVAIIFGGPAWYRFFGAGDKMAELAESGSQYPTVVTLIIATILMLWALYAFAGAGYLIRLPLMKVALVAISLVYLARGVAGLVLPFVTQHPAILQNSITFWLVSSIICLIFGGFYLMGTVKSWASLSAT